jgi:hypothetical protein
MAPHRLTDCNLFEPRPRTDDYRYLKRRLTDRKVPDWRPPVLQTHNLLISITLSSIQGSAQFCRYD